MTFDTKEEAYHAGMADGYNEGYNQGSDQGEQQRHELEVQVEELKEEIRKLEDEIQLCPATRYHTQGGLVA